MPVRPSSAQVLSELESLREGIGLSPERIRTKAPRLQELPIVSDQLDLEGLHPSDSHLAAYSAIGCVVEHSISDYQQQQILILTLRYDSTLLGIRRDAEAWNDVSRAPILSQRDALVQALLFYGKTAYFEKRKAAYAELANQLSMRRRTPCRAAGAEQVAVETLRLSLRQLLGYFTIEGRAVFREVLAEEALPLVHDRWKQEVADSASGLLWSAIHQAIREAYPAAVAEATALQRRGSSAAGTGALLDGLALKALLGPHRFQDFWFILLEISGKGYESSPEGRLADSLNVLSWVLTTGGYSATVDVSDLLGSPRAISGSIDDSPIIMIDPAKFGYVFPDEDYDDDSDDHSADHSDDDA